jgi:hypothetical protein
MLALGLGVSTVLHDIRGSEAGPGCKNVGASCDRPGECCSGVCKRKRKNGKKRCRAHDTGGCKPTEDSCVALVTCQSSTGFEGECYVTTGNAGYCGVGNACTACRTDKDCEQELGQAGAACVKCENNGCGIPGLKTVCKSPSPD